MSRFIRYIDEPSAEAIYKEVVSKIPDVEEKELRLELSDITKYAALCMIDLEEDKKGLFVRDPKIYIGPKFFELSEDKKRAAIGHEIGHYKHERGCTDEEIKQHTADKRALIRHFNRIKSLPAEEIEKLMQKAILNETQADNCAAELGYGEPMLEYVIDLCKVKSHILQDLLYSPALEAEIRIVKARIQNLRMQNIEVIIKENSKGF